MTIEELKGLRGLIATVNLTGTVHVETMRCAMEMRAWNLQNGFANLEYQEVPATLVEAGRDLACSHALKEKYDFLLMYDGDATFPANAFARLLQDAYQRVPDADLVGAYSQLKTGRYLPTIDTGTGTWEVHYPGEGVVEVIRTGGHFLLLKTSLLQKFGPPWFRTRLTQRPIDAFLEIDNYARCRLDGKNPFTQLPQWEQLLQSARKESQGEAHNVGEDSGFCDRAKAAGARLFVDTDLVTGHVSKKVIGPQDLKDMEEQRLARLRQAVGVIGNPGT